VSADRSRRQLLLAFSGLLLGMLLASLDQTIVATALPTIAGDLGSLDHLSWVVTAYLLASTATTPLWGRISDLYGRKALFQATIVIFLIGSALSGAAQNLDQLIAFRAFQGLGAGGLMTLAIAIVGDLVSPRERARYQGYINLVFVLASVGGPLLGGLLVDHASWRWVFYVNLPVGAVALAVITATLHLPAKREPHRIDYLGGALLVAAISAVLLISVWGGDRYRWGSAPIVCLASLAVALLAAFVAQERRAAEPILPLRLFRDPAFDVTSAALFIATCSLFAAIVFMPVFFQVVTGATATESGLLLVPMMIATTASTIVGGRIIARTGRYKVFPIVGLATMALGLLLLSRLHAGTSRSAAALVLVVFGLGFGLVTQVLMIAVQNAVDRKDLGIATASANLFRALGGALGVAVYGAVFSGRLHLPVGLDAKAVQGTPERIRHLPPEVHDAVVHGVAHALHSVFLVGAPIALAGAVVLLGLRERPLRTA
jgi:EmrB/QacA subfamily drug resistance transporter